jgi:hypothetical protein
MGSRQHRRLLLFLLQVAAGLERSRETPLLALAGFELPPKGRRLVPMNYRAT